MSTTQKDDYVDEAEVWRVALQQIANADLRRCSAGWLQRIAMDALASTGQAATATTGPK